MSFFNKDEKKAGGPALPGSPFKKSSAFGKTPMFSRAAGGLVDRLKNLSKRDMAFVGIGLSVLVMAPVAEYMMSQPVQDPMLTASGFGSREGGPNGVYEPGVNGLSTGSPDGGSEVITPLSSRDPASLILGAEPAPAPAPAAAPAAPPSGSWRDAMADSGRAAFSAAAKSAGAPTPINRMNASLRSMTFFGDGSSSRTTGTLGGGNIIDKAKKASGKATSRSMVGPVAMAGYKGVASNTPNSASKGEFEKLRSAADKSASNFSGGSAMNSLDKAAADAVEIGKGNGGIGALGDGDATKGSSAYDNKYTHQRSGESLAEMAQKQRLNKALEWEFFKKYEIPKQIINAVVGAIAKELGDAVGGAVHGVLNPAGPQAPTLYCWKQMGGSWVNTNFTKKDCFDKDGKLASGCTDCIFQTKDCNPTGPQGTCGGGTPTPGPGGGDGHQSGGSPTAGYTSPTVTWPTQDISNFDQYLAQFRLDIKAAADKHGRPGQFTEAAYALGKEFKDMTGQSAKDSSFIVVLHNLKAKAETLNGAQSGFAGKVDAASGYLAQLQRDNESLRSTIDGYTRDNAVLAKIASNMGTAQGSDKTVPTGKATDTAGTNLDGPKQMLEKLIAELNENTTAMTLLAPQMEFMGNAKGFFAAQAAEMNNDVQELQGKNDSLVSEAESGPVTLFKSYKDKFSANKDVALTEQDLKALANAFNTLTGFPVEVDGSAPDKTEDGATLTERLLKLRGADKDAYYKKSKVDDAKFTDEKSDLSEKVVWPPISPKKKLFLNMMNDKLTPPEALKDERKVTPVLNVRIADELTDEIAAFNTRIDDLKNTDLQAAQNKIDDVKKKLDAILNPGGSQPNTPTTSTSTVQPVTPPANSTATVNPPVSGGNTASGNTAVSAADAALGGMNADVTSASGRLVELDGKTRDCTSTVCKNNLALAHQKRDQMDALRADVEKLKTEARQPGADLARIEDDIKKKQAQFNTAKEEFTRAANIVAEREGIPSHTTGGNGSHPTNGNGSHPTNGNGDQHPTPNPDTNHGTAKPTPPPNVINTVVLYNGPATIKAWDKNGKAIMFWACPGGKITAKPWYQRAGQYALTAVGGPLVSMAYGGYVLFGDDPRVNNNCSTGWKQQQATIKVEDFSLAPLGKVPSPAQRKLGNIPVYQEQVWIGDSQKMPQTVGTEARWARENWSVLKRGHYEMDIDVVCEWNETRKRWEFKEVGMTHGTAESSDAYGVEAGVSAGIKVVDVDVKASYHHEQRQFNYGVKTDYTRSAGFSGMECK